MFFAKPQYNALIWYTNLWTTKQCTEWKKRKKSAKKTFVSKNFVSLRLIVRGEMLRIRRSHIRAVEGNLCLYPIDEIWKIFENGYKIRVDQSILYSIFLVDTYRLGEQCLFYSQRLFQSLCAEKQVRTSFLAFLWSVLLNWGNYKQIVYDKML